MRRAATRLGLAGLAVLALSAPAYAAWTATSDDARGTAAAVSLPSGSAPTGATRLGRDVQVTWPQVSFRGSLLKAYASGGYVLTRDGVEVGSPCTGLPATSGAATASCREDGLAPGTYAYRVVPALGSWRGAASAPTSVTVPAPSLALSPASWSGPSTSFSGALDGFLDGAGLVYRLDDPTSGALLSGSLTTFPTAPSGTVATTVPVACGPAGTTHTVYVASDTSPAAGTFSADFGTVLCPAAVTSTNAGTARRAGPGDTISITWSRAINPSSVCADLAGADGSTAPYDNVDVTVVDGGAADDHVTVTVPVPSTLLGLGATNACGSVAPTLFLGGQPGTVTLGTVSLGAKDYVSGAPLVFSGTGSARSTLSLSGSTLTITLGALSSGTPLTSAATGPASYAPPAGISSASGSLSAQGFMTSGGPLL